MGLERDIEDYLRRHAQRDVESVVNQLQARHQLLLFGETHVGLPRKAQFFASLVRDGRRAGLLRFHASEHFYNDTRTHGDEIERFLTGRIDARSLSSTLRPFAPLLTEIKASLPHFGVVFAGTPSHTQRDRRIFNHFTSSRQRHIDARRFTTRDRGHFYLGAHHAGRLPETGATKTTCGYLIDSRIDVHVIRMTTDVEPNDSTSGGAFVIRGGESIWVQPHSGGDSLDLLPVLQRVSAGSPFIADLKQAHSPFAEIVPEEGTNRYTQIFDHLLHLPQ